MGNDAVSLLFTCFLFAFWDNFKTCFVVLETTTKSNAADEGLVDTDKMNIVEEKKDQNSCI